MTPTAPVLGVVSDGRRRLRACYARRPLATAAALFGLLAVVRVGGAYVPAALVASVLVTPAVSVAASPEQLGDLGLRRPTSARSVAGGVGVVVVAYAVTVGACVLAFGVGSGNWASGLLSVFDGVVPPTAPGHRMLTLTVIVVSLGVVVPLAEEICFRGFLMHAVATRHGPGRAVVVTSAAWALVHLGNYGLSPFEASVVLGVLPSVFVMGLALGWCRLTTGSILACAAAQGIANLLLAAWVSTW